jgi:hypothetical protein
MNTDEKIVVQVAAKIASELIPLTGKTQVEDILVTFDELFQGVLGRINGIIHADKPAEQTGTGRKVPIAKSQAEIMTALVDAQKITTEPTSGSAVQTNMFVNNAKKNAAKNVTIRGDAHGELPAWLLRNATKAGVTEVYDNRDKATDENRRPHFVSTDGSKKGFWPPKLDNNSIAAPSTGTPLVF